MRATAVGLMIGILFVVSVSTASAAPTISCDFESNTWVSPMAYPDTTTNGGNCYPDALVAPFGAGAAWISGGSAAVAVQVTSYGTPGPHGGSNYLRLNRTGGGNAVARLFAGTGGHQLFGPLIRIDTWTYAAETTWNNMIDAYGNNGWSAAVGYGPSNNVVYYSGGWNNTGLIATQGVWQHLVVELNLSTQKMAVTLDGSTVSDLPFEASITWVNQIDFSASNTTAYFDDIAIYASFVSVTGQVNFNEYLGDLAGLGVTVELNPTGGGPTQVKHAILDANGRFAIPDVETDTYNITVKASGGLSQTLSSIVVSGNPTDIGSVVFAAGDINGNDNVSATDLSVVLANMDLAGDGGSGLISLDRGHRMLIRKGLQIEAQAYPGSVPPYGDFDLSAWQASNFTGPNFETVNYAPLYLPAGMPWSRIDSAPYYLEITMEELPYLANMIAFQYDDEQSMDNATNRAQAAAVLADHRVKYPDVLGFTNQSGNGSTTAGLQAYMQEARPDMLMFDEYPYNTGVPVGGSPTVLYNALAKYRSLALAGNDGSGTTPIPFGQYLQTFKDNLGGWNRFPSDSEMRLQQFAGWTFGCTFARAWVYNKPQSDYDSPFFIGYGDTLGDATSAFYQIAETNRQSRNLGKTLVRLLSTDVRFIAGLHGSPPGTANTLPTGMSTWSAGADPYITSISATNLGSTNNGLKGDVLIGYFKPILESDDGSAYSNQIYFMITNGLSDATGLVADTQQQIQIDFNFGASGITSLQRLSRTTGTVETVSLTPLGGSLYRLTLTLEGGTGDLFKFNTGAPFITGPEAMTALPGTAFTPRISCNFESNTWVSPLAYPDTMTNGGNCYPDALVAPVGIGAAWIGGGSAAVNVQVTSYGTPGAHGGSKYLRLNRTGGGGAVARLHAGSGGNQLFGPVIRVDTWTYMEDGSWNNGIDLYGNNGWSAAVCYGPSNNVVYYDAATGWTTTGLIGIPGQWQHLIVDLDLTAQRMSITLDGSTVSNLPFYAAISWINQIDFTATNDTAYFDDVIIAQPTANFPSLTGTLVLGDYSGDTASVGITVDMYLQNSKAVRTERVLLGADGKFTVSTVYPGLYEVAIKAGTWLQKVFSSVNLYYSADLGTVTLTNGDVDGDNEITSSDLAILLTNLE